MSYGLLSRILTHAEERGWLTPQSIVLDCFGGVGTTGILGAYKGYQTIAVELEAKFVSLAKQNFELHHRAFEEFGCPYPVILQGDSRKLCELVESADIIVSSPPFCEAQTGGGIAKNGYHNETQRKGVFDLVGKRSYMPDNQGQTPGQLGSLKPGKVDVVISSPPFQESSGAMAKPESYKGFEHVGSVKHKNNDSKAGYGSTEGNLGNLKAEDVSLILSSPPFENSLQTQDVEFNRKKAIDHGRNPDGYGNIGGMSNYGETEGQIGKEKGPTFWQAAKEILQQCHKILRPGGHAIFVCKDFIRKGQRVPFSDDWLRLCEAVGFKLVCRHKAMLVKEETHKSLFGHDITKKVERKSFFRRLTEAKGSPKIDWEDVICVEKADKEG